MSQVFRVHSAWKWIALFLGLFFGSATTACATPIVKLGIDVLTENHFHGLEGKRVGLITNQTGVNASAVSTIDILRGTSDVKLVALYAPEHGVYGADYAGQYVASTTDKRTGLRIFSLYGPTRKPTPEMLKGIDVIIYDIQDIGCRSYTFISTLGLAMEAAGEAGIEFYVLDRPNPLNGNRVEGMPLNPQFRSFVGQWDIPYVYGLTPGELARMIHGEKWIVKRPKLTIVPMKGWERGMDWKQTGLVWVPTSPHIPTPEAAAFYVATGLLGELGTVDNGVGYTLPFSLCASPSFQAWELADVLNNHHLSGIYFRPILFKPFYGASKDQIDRGVQLMMLDPDRVNLCQVAMVLLEESRKKLGPILFTKPNSEKIKMFDKVCGTDEVRKHFSAGRSAKEILSRWDAGLETFRQMRQKYLIYVPPVHLPETPPPVEMKKEQPSEPAKKEATTTRSTKPS